MALAVGSVSFFTFLSLVPLALLAITIAAPFFTDFLKNTVQPIVGANFYHLLETQLNGILDGTGISIFVALLIGLWSGGNIFITLESAMNLVWGATKSRPLWRRRLLAVFMIFLFAVCLIIAFIFVNIIRLAPISSSELFDVKVLTSLQSFALTYIIPTILVITLFGTIYYMLPNVAMPLRIVLPGAITAGIAWTISLHIFSWFATYSFERYKALYGSITSIFILLLWMYYSSYILLFGAEISAAAYRLKKIKRKDIT